VSLRFAASEYLDVFMFILAYFGVILCIKHDLLKYIFALQISNFPLIFLYLFMLYAKLAFTILIVGFSTLLRVYSQSQIKLPYATQFSVFTLYYINLHNMFRPLMLNPTIKLRVSQS
jgi:hypothetical protein